MCASKMTGPSGRGKGNSLLGKASSRRGWREESKENKDKSCEDRKGNMDRWPWEPYFVQFFSILLKFAFFEILLPAF